MRRRGGARRESPLGEGEGTGCLRGEQQGAPLEGIAGCGRGKTAGATRRSNKKPKKQATGRDLGKGGRRAARVHRDGESGGVDRSRGHRAQRAAGIERRRTECMQAGDEAQEDAREDAREDTRVDALEDAQEDARR